MEDIGVVFLLKLSLFPRVSYMRRQYKHKIRKEDRYTLCPLPSKTLVQEGAEQPNSSTYRYAPTEAEDACENERSDCDSVSASEGGRDIDAYFGKPSDERCEHPAEEALCEHTFSVAHRTLDKLLGSLLGGLLDGTGGEVAHDVLFLFFLIC